MCREDINIPDALKWTISGELFFFFASENEEIVIFTTVKNLQKLQDCNNWHGDGTFKIVPWLFDQLYTIHRNYLGQILPFGKKLYNF